MFYKVKEVKALPDYKLKVYFVNDVIKIYDVKPLFDTWPAFQALRDIQGLYKLVKVDPGGYGISWNENIDLSCNELWEAGKLSDDEKQIA